MNATRAVDLEDTEGLLAADREGLLRAASTAGAQVRAVAAAVDEGELELLRGSENRPRSLIWVAGRGTAETAGAMLAATLGTAAAEPIVLTNEAPPWVGPLDVLVIAGDDPGDPTLVSAAATGVRRGARVVVAAPYAGPLRDSTAGRVAVLAPRLPVPDEFGLCRYLAVGLATAQAVDPKLRTDLAALADALDAEALRNSATRELFTNPAKTLAERISGRRIALAGDGPATLALARHGSSMLLRIANQAVGAAGLADAVTALRSGPMGQSSVDALFHDEEFDGPLPDRLRVLALTLRAERTVVSARVAGLDDVYLVAADDVPALPDGPVEIAGDLPTALVDGATAAGTPAAQLALLAVRLEMVAVYLRLVRG